MNRAIYNNIPLYHFKNLSEYSNIKHFITSKNGGISTGNYDSFNMGYGTDDLQEHVFENRKLLASAIGIEIGQFVFPRQTHTNNAEIVTITDKGKGVFTKEDAIPVTDALITDQTGICIMIQVADCVPVLLFDPHKKVIAAIHAGWRGTATNIVGITIEKMQSEFGCLPSDIIAGIGPSIGPCCYEVGFEVSAQFEELIPNEKVIDYKPNKKPVLNLWHTNKNLLTSAGIRPENIEISDFCTLCNHETFYSSRYFQGDTGRFTAGIMLQN
jgi:YfiH family protein